MATVLSLVVAATSMKAASDVVDATTLDRKLLFGYQGWFACPNDGSPANRWWYWFRHGSAVATNANVDFWPDVSELDPDERFSTKMTLPDGTTAAVFSSFKQKTVVRHFKWMKDYHLDGVFLERFVCELPDKRFRQIRDQVTENVRLGAEQYGRVFAIEYDISGANQTTFVRTLTNDWRHLVALGVTNSPRYLRHNGKPVVAIWGFGFGSRPGTPEDALTVINFFKSAGLTVIGGVPPYWRTLKEEAKTGPGWAKAYRSFHIINPWMVGRFEDWKGADDFKRRVIVTYARDSIWNFDSWPFKPLTGVEVVGTNFIVIQGERFAWVQADLKEVLRLLHHPMGTIRIHRILPAAEGQEAEVRTLAARIEQQLTAGKMGQRESRLEDYLATLHVGMTPEDAERQLKLWGCVPIGSINQTMRHQQSYIFIPSAATMTLQYDDHGKLISWKGEQGQNPPAATPEEGR